MFNVGSTELLIILLLVFLLFGPKHIPDVARTLGRGLGDMQRALRGVEDGVRRAAQDLPRIEPPAIPPPAAVRRPMTAVEIPAPPPGAGIPEPAAGSQPEANDGPGDRKGGAVAGEAEAPPGSRRDGA